MQSISRQNKAMLEIINLSIGYKTSGDIKLILKHLNLSLNSGQFVCLLGANGSGKSTLIRTLCKLQPPIEGTVKLNINKSKTENKYFKNEIAVVLTTPVYAPNFTVFDMVASGRYQFTNWIGKLSDDDYSIVNQSIKLAGVEHLTKRMISQLSDGERQRTMIAKALAQQSPIIILDEPTAHLDLINRVEITKLLMKLAHEENKAILMATHELDFAIQSADKLWIMNDSEIIIGSPEDLVLNGDLENVFGKLSLLFDNLTGSFKIKPNLYKSINFKNKTNSLYEIWTERALNKLGFEINDKTEKSSLYFNLDNKIWTVKSEDNSLEFNSLESLCNYLVSI